MTKQELKQILKDKKGYLKKGVQWLSNKFDVTPELVKEVIKEVKDGKVKTFDLSDFAASQIQDGLARLSKSNKPKQSRISVDSNRITEPGTYWITGCAHAPFQNKAMYEATFKYLTSEVSLDGIILAGDIIDANSLSAHDRGNVPIEGVTLEWEYKESNKFLDQIDFMYDWCKSDINIRKYYLYGNHEDRYNRLLRSVDASKYGDALKSPVEGLKLEKRGYKVFTDWKNDVIHFGKYLDINHGEFCNVHSAKKTIDTYRKSMLYFHTHRFQIFMEGMNAGFNMGAGADFTAPVFGYATRAMKTSWVNASAIATLDEFGGFHVQPLLFINNKLIVNGKQY